MSRLHHLCPTAFLIAVLAGLTGLFAPAASADAGVGPETRVRAIDHPAPASVGAVDLESSTSVGVSGLHLRRFVSATGVATEQVALDSSTARALITDGPVGRRLESQLAGCDLVMCSTAMREFDDGVARLAGPSEKAAADALRSRVTVVPDDPSARAANLTLTGRVGANDRVIFGTADEMGIPIFTSDFRFLSGAHAQGFTFDAIVHPPASMRGL
jgi:hypothetical protein